MASTIVPIGSYTIRKKRTAAPSDNIISPGVQTCLVVVLESSDGIAVAHIDTPLVVSRLMHAIIGELKSYGPGEITARLYGGDYGLPLINSTSISEQIYAILDKKHIRYSHRDYHLTIGFFMALAAAVWAFSPLGPESMFMALALIALAYKSTTILKSSLSEKWRPGFLVSNIDVCVNIATGRVCLVRDNQKNSHVLLSEAKCTLTRQGQWDHIERRTNLNPRNPGNTAALRMLRLD